MLADEETSASVFFKLILLIDFFFKLLLLCMNLYIVTCFHLKVICAQLNFAKVTFSGK